MVGRALLVLAVAGSLFAGVGSVAASGATLALAGVRISPARPVAGRPFRLEATVVSAPRRRRSAPVTVTCVGGVGGPSLNAHRGKFDDGVASCRWRFARSTRGRRFRGTIFVRRGHRSAQAFVTARLR